MRIHAKGEHTIGPVLGYVLYSNLGIYGFGGEEDETDEGWCFYEFGEEEDEGSCVYGFG